MQREIDVLRATEEMFRKNILEFELTMTTLSGQRGIFSPKYVGILCVFIHNRAATSSLSDLEVKLNKTIERNVILGKSSPSKKKMDRD